jgi:iron(III) transport system ATP-binding protein
MTLVMKKVSVECRNIRLAYDRTEVLNDVSLRIEPGEFFALLGPSGSGKSTLLRLIAGFNRQQQGTLLVDGKDIGNIAPHARNIGMVFQSYALWPHLSVYDNVAFGLVERKVPRAEIARRVAEALETVGLGTYAQRRPNQLSGGQQQRVALARTIVIEPQVLLLDEPLSNLDKNLRVQMRAELLALQRRLGITTIFVTHDQEEAMTTADRMAVLDRGVVQQIGTPAQLYDFPVNRFVASFVGTMNMLPGRVGERRDGRISLQLDGIGDFVLPDTGEHAGAQRLAASFRPHTLQLVPAAAATEPAGGGGPQRGDGEQPAARIWLQGTVQASEFSGEFTRYRIQVGPQALIADRMHHAGSVEFAPGSKVAVGIAPADVRLLDD